MIVGCAAVYWTWNEWFYFKEEIDYDKAGQIGDKFGALNTLFTGLAFVGLLATFIHERQKVAEADDDLKKTLAAQRETTLALNDLAQIGKAQMAQRQAEKREIESALVEAILAEVRVLWAHYVADVGNDIKNLNPSVPSLQKKYSINGGYFRVFKSCAGQLGLLQDSKLREAIINFYLKAEALLDMLRQNNEILDKINATHNNDANFAQLRAYGLSVTRGHREFEDAARAVLGKID